MPVLNKIAYFQNRRDEAPNQELARELAETKNKKGIQEIAENLGHQNQNVQIPFRPGIAASRDDAIPGCAAQENHQAVESAVRRAT